VQHESTFTIDTRRQRHLPPTRMGGAALSSFRVDATKQHGTSSPLRQRAAQKYIRNRYEEAAPLTSNTNGRSSSKLLPSGCNKQHGTSSPLRQRAAQKYIRNRYEEAAPLTSNTNGRSSSKLLPSGCIEAARYFFATEATYSAKVHSQWIRGTSATYRQQAWKNQCQAYS
jgi:hypothetical protein